MALSILIQPVSRGLILFRNMNYSMKAEINQRDKNANVCNKIILSEDLNSIKLVVKRLILAITKSKTYISRANDSVVI